MTIDNLLGAAVRIRRGWHGGRIGKVIVFDQHSSQGSSYSVIKVQLDRTGEVVNVYGDDGLEKLTALPGRLSL